MGESFIKKNGLLYSEDLHTLVGVDDTSTEFSGRIPYGVHAIDDEVFSDCPYETVSIPDSVKKLGACLFENSKKLQKVKLPYSITELSPYMFNGCEALTKVTMPNELAILPEGLFQNCTSLCEVPFKSGIQEIPEHYADGCSAVKSVVFPLSLKKISSCAFANCTGLESIVLPSGIEEISPDAFENCSLLSSIRLEGESQIFYVGDDGSLYRHSDSSDELVIQNAAKRNQSVSFFKENVDDETEDTFDDDDEEEEDFFFSAEIGASDEETGIVDLTEDQNENIDKSVQESNMADESNVDAMLADIMGAEKERNQTADASVSENESRVMSEMMDIMSDSSSHSNTGAVTADELANLFSKNEENEAAGNDENPSDVKNPDGLDSKTQILVDSVEFSKILTFEPSGDVPEDSDLFVIAEKTVTDAAGQKSFSEKLEACCKTFAKIHDFKRVIMLNGLPLDNDEFMQFYFHFINKRNVILACEASSPSKLSDYCKSICNESRISLETADLTEQRKRISIKTDTLIKLVIQDKY